MARAKVQGEKTASRQFGRRKANIHFDREISISMKRFRLCIGNPQMAFRDLPLVERRVASQKKGELRDLSGRMESDGDAGAYQGQY
jgi:hypothetical protein